MRTKKTKQKMLDLLQDQRLSPADLRQRLTVSASVVHDHLRSLLEEERIEKFGSAPQVFYRVRERSAVDVVEEFFVFQDVLGVLHRGIDGFRLWSEQGLKKLSFEEKISLYADRIATMESNRHNGLFDLTDKLQKVCAVGEAIYLKKMVAFSLRTLQDFGRTKMGMYMDIVKSVGNKDIMQEILEYAVPLLVAYVKRYKIGAVGFIPPTRKRDQQIMTLLKKRFQKASVRVVVFDITKIRTQGASREQKTIRDLKDRVYNAEHTFLLSPYAHLHNYKRVLLVDDFVGSGATLNQVAKIAKESGFVGEVFGVGIVGEERGYSVEKVS